MRKRFWAMLALASALVAALAATAGTGTIATTTVGGGAAAGKDGAAVGHAKPLPAFVQKWQNEKIAAAGLVARGQAKPDANGLVRLKNGKFVDYQLQGEEYLTLALIDFADFEHNAIPQPDRSVDNSTYWKADFTPQHYSDMLFTPGGGSYGHPSMRDFYLEQSSGRFTWTGQVSDWVTVSGTAANYGANDRKSGAGGDDLNGPVFRVVRDTLVALSKAPNYGGLDLVKADQWDRYDCDEDGNRNEPDGYIDHFGIAHAGEGEDAGGGPLAGDAIWSHRWYANLSYEFGSPLCKRGGYNLPGTDLWVGDYTIEPENGGVGVFAHEFGHDLGLPDLYDTAGGDNGTGFWTLMSSGSWTSTDTTNIGTQPVHMGAWEKLVLGWLGDDLATANAGDTATFELGPAEGATRGKAQALAIGLPSYTQSTTVAAPEGSDPYFFYSTKGNDVDTKLVKQLPAALSAATPLSFRANYSTETDWDYAYVDALVNGAWVHLQTSASTTTNPFGQNFGFGITGASGGWTTITTTVPAGATAYRFRYWTDGAVVGPGFLVDSVQLGSGGVDDSSSPAAWTLQGFVQVVNGTYAKVVDHYYLVESRSYLRSDAALCGAYNFLFGNFVERNCYADGLLISYANGAYDDNNTSQHPGYGQVLPVDAHPEIRFRTDGKTPWRARWQTWDATFGVEPNSVTLTDVKQSGKQVKQTFTAQPVSVFHDSSTDAYYNPALPQNSVKTAGSGIKLAITGISADKASYQVRLSR